MQNFDFTENISVYDYGFLYGFGLFETFLASEMGCVFLLDRHLDRLYKSIEFFKYDLSVTKDELKSDIIRYIESNSISNKILRLSVSFGNKSREIAPAISITHREIRRNPQSYKLNISSSRRNECSILVCHKTSNYLENFIEGQNALSTGFDDTLFLNFRNEIAETSKCNVFFVKNNSLYTPDISCGILPGIIREWVIEQCRELGIDCCQGRFPLSMLYNSDEVFVTNSVIGIMPVTTIENHIIKQNSQNTLANLLNTYLSDIC